MARNQSFYQSIFYILFKELAVKHAIIQVATLVSLFLIAFTNSSRAQQSQHESTRTNTIVTTGTTSGTITFEDIPGVGTPRDGMEISTQFRDTAGVTFILEGGGFPQIAQVGEPVTAFRGPPNNSTPDMPAPGQNVGSFFLTDNGRPQSSDTPPFIIQYDSPTAAASGVILDIDLEESFTIEARDANGQVIEQIMRPGGAPGTGDGIATPWSFDRQSNDIFSIRFVGVKAGSGGVGLAFDNFSARSATPPPVPPPSSSGLVLEIETQPNPVLPGEAIAVELTVGNASNTELSDVVLELRYPEGLERIFDSVISGGGACNNTNFCDPTHIVVWDLGTLAAGQGVTVSVSAPVALDTLPGRTIEFVATVKDSSNSTTTARKAVEVVAERNLDLTLSETGSDPVIPGNALSYALTFGHSATTAFAEDTVLSLPVPAGLTFVSATDGGALVDDRVEWMLGTLNPGQVGEHRATFSVNADQEVGTLIRADATIQSTQPNQVGFADAVTRVASEAPLQLAVETQPNPVRPGEATNVEVTVTNTMMFDRLGVVLELRYPEGLERIFDSVISGGGACNNTNFCDPTHIVVWDLGTLAAGQGVTVSVSAPVALDTLPGRTIEFVATVKDSSNSTTTARKAVEVVAERNLARLSYLPSGVLC